MAYLAKDLALEKVPVDLELVDHGAHGDQLHLGGLVDQTFVEGFVKEYSVVGFIFNFSLGPFFLTSLLG
jgi:hypothetical protein